MSVRHLTIMVLLLAALLAHGAGGPRLAEGIAQVSRGRYAAAVLTLQPLAEACADDSQYHYWLGRAYYGLRNYTLAAEALGRAAEQDAGFEDACYWHARALRMAGEDADALAAYMAYAARFPRHTNLQLEYAALRALAGDLPGARAVLDAALARLEPARRGQGEALRRTLDVLAERGRLVPLFERLGKQFRLHYEPGEKSASLVFNEVDRARQEISAATGTPIEGFRVLLFAGRDSYLGYAGLAQPESDGRHAVAFSSPGELVLWSPDNWAAGRTRLDVLRQVLRHEMVHLAIMAHGRGEGVPLWLNEGLACYFGGWGGLQAGTVPATPLTLDGLEHAFTLGDAPAATAAYAQAHAMVTVLAANLGAPALLVLVDRLAAGTPLQAAYPALANEPLDTFLAQWPARHRALPAPAGK